MESPINPGWFSCTELCVVETCGDAIVQSPEECDDGNDIDTDACTNACKDAICGDGIVQDGQEDCDVGTHPSMVCTVACQFVQNSCSGQYIQYVTQEGMEGYYCGCKPGTQNEGAQLGDDDCGEPTYPVPATAEPYCVIRKNEVCRGLWFYALNETGQTYGAFVGRFIPYGPYNQIEVDGEAIAPSSLMPDFFFEVTSDPWSRVQWDCPNSLFGGYPSGTYSLGSTSTSLGSDSASCSPGDPHYDWANENR